MEIQRTTATATNIIVPLIDTSARPSYRASPTLASGDVKIIRHTGGAWTYNNIASLPAFLPVATKQVAIALTATEMTSDDLAYPIIIQFVDQTSPKEWDDQEIIIWTKPLQADITYINGSSVSGNNATLSLKQLNIVNSSGPAIAATGGESSAGAIFQGGSGGGHGIIAIGGDNGIGTVAGCSIYLPGSTTAEAGQTEGEGCGMFIGGQSQMSPALLVKGYGNCGGAAFFRACANGHAILATGSGYGAGFNARGGTHAAGISAIGGSIDGDGIYVSKTSGYCLNFDTTANDLHSGTISAIKAKTDQTTFTNAGIINSNVVDWKGSTAPAMTGDAYAVVNNETYGNSALKTSIDTVYVTEGDILSALATAQDDLIAIISKLPSSGTVSSMSLSDLIDGVALRDLFQLTLAMVNGRFLKDYPNTGDVTFFKRDNTTVLTTVNVTDTERTRL